jgi:hypothetical protein
MGPTGEIADEYKINCKFLLKISKDTQVLILPEPGAAGQVEWPQYCLPWKPGPIPTLWLDKKYRF